MSTPGAVCIAGNRTSDDWRLFRTKLLAEGNSDAWEHAFKDYFYERISLRYLNPIHILQEHGTFQGEGFSIVAIQCTLVEFLESTIKGVSYHYLRKGETLAPYEYTRSRDLFVGFLSKRNPFSSYFSETLARDFYVNVRCGLLHEARTKGGWRIWALEPSGRIIDGCTKTVYRDNFQSALLEFIGWYRTALLTDVALQQALVRKFDKLCE